MNTNKHKVVLLEFEHKANACYGLRFDYNYDLKEIIKTLDHVKWSASNKLFYIPKNKISLHQLYSWLHKKNIYVDYSKVKAGKSAYPKRKKSPRKISDANKDVIRAFVEYLKGLRLSKSTVKVYFTFVANFVEFIEEKPLETLNNTDVRLFVEQQVARKRYAISTHRQLVSAIKHFGTFLPESNLSVEDIKRPHKSRYLPAVLSIEEVIDLLRATKNLKHRAVIALLYSAGLRVGELINLHLKEIDVDRRQLVVKNAKGRKDRVVILAESFVPLFKNYYLTYKPSIYFVENPEGGVYSAGSIRKFLKKSCREAGIKKPVTPHTLRHSYATHLIENGVGLRYVQDLLGHSKPETTMIYTHVAKKDLLKIQSPLDTAILSLSKTDKSDQLVRLSQNNKR